MTYRIEDAKNEDNWKIRGKITHKRIFVHRNTEIRRTHHLLTITLMDSSGETIELKSWNINKVYCVYRKVRVNQCYEVSGHGVLDTPNQTYSTSKYQVHSRWWIEPIDRDLELERFLKCVSNLKKIVNSLKQGPLDVLGVFVGMTEGPAKYYIQGKPAVKGYFVTLADDSNCLFNVLVWHTTRIDKSKFPLFSTKKGDTILIPAARISYPPADLPKSEQLQTLTTICSPVVDSECVKPSRISDLKRRFNSTSKFNKILAS